MNMTGKMYKATLKAIWRSPVLWICVCLSLLFLANEASNYQVASSRTYHKLISNFVLTPIMLEIPIIIGIAAGTDMLRERKNRVLDIIRTKPDVTLRLYIAKILSYITRRQVARIHASGRPECDFNHGIYGALVQKHHCQYRLFGVLYSY